ncbi:MAG: hypothetical protein K0S58_1351 [Nitrospira sp.]|nr:hypothetical protein [Nitrospira sp.]
MGHIHDFSLVELDAAMHDADSLELNGYHGRNRLSVGLEDEIPAPLPRFASQGKRRHREDLQRIQVFRIKPEPNYSISPRVGFHDDHEFPATCGARIVVLSNPEPAICSLGGRSR